MHVTNRLQEDLVQKEWLFVVNFELNFRRIAFCQNGLPSRFSGYPPIQTGLLLVKRANIRVFFLFKQLVAKKTGRRGDNGGVEAIIEMGRKWAGHRRINGVFHACAQLRNDYFHSIQHFLTREK